MTASPPTDDLIFMEDHLNLYRRPFAMFDTPDVILDKTVLELYDDAKEEHEALMKQLFDSCRKGEILLQVSLVISVAGCLSNSIGSGSTTGLIFK